jgi:hypothetical protein
MVYFFAVDPTPAPAPSRRAPLRPRELLPWTAVLIAGGVVGFLIGLATRSATLAFIPVGVGGLCSALAMDRLSKRRAEAEASHAVENLVRAMGAPG